MRKKTTLFVALSTVICLIMGTSLVSFVHQHGRPGNQMAPVGEDEEGPDKEARIRAYNELIHRAAPGVDWRYIETQNAIANEQYRMGGIASKTTGSFAGGLINGTWYERGNNNTAGRMSAFAYESSGNTLYSMSDAGTLWKTNPPAGIWTLLNDQYKLRSKTLAITSISTGTRIMMARDSQLVYTDNSGSSLQVATGISFPVAWSGNYVDKIFTLNDTTHSVYALASGWNSSPWSAGVWLFRSVDSGQSFSKIYSFANTSVNQVSLFSPYNTSQLYALAVNGSGSTTTDTLFSINGSTVSKFNVTTSFPTNSSQAVLTGLMNGTQLQLYALINDNQIFESSNNGASWNSVDTLSTASWHVLTSSTKVVGNLFYGNNEAYRSSNGGTSFTKVNAWGDYYPSPATKLHADIQAISFFQDATGNEFCVISTDGGAYYTSNYMVNVSNMSLTGLRVNQLWHHISHPNDPNILISGMQDQGLCHTTAAGGTGLISQTQIISGDYGQMRITGGDILWAQYPGGNMYLYSNITTTPQYVTSYNMQGNQKSNAAWMMPTCAIPGFADEILLGGGNTTGGSGSYLARLTLNSGNVIANQFPFNFRAGSNSGTSGLSTLAISELNRKMWYAAAEDGTFFWSSDAGANWTKTAAFSGVTGFWLYGATIAPSKKDRGTVYYGGSGYSNPGVFVSRDSGLSFTAMNTGLPPTLVNGLAVSPGDSMIFAATDAGPYVYITAQQQWYPLIDANTPGPIWKNVEFIPSIRTARFSTYGRGVWDLILSNPVNTNGISGSAKVPEQVAVYPNPAHSGGNVILQGLAQGKAMLYLHDMNGRTLFSGAWSGQGPVRLPVVASGMYLCSIRQDDNIYKGRLMIQ